MPAVLSPRSRGRPRPRSRQIFPIAEIQAEADENHIEDVGHRQVFGGAELEANLGMSPAPVVEWPLHDGSTPSAVQPV